MTTGRKRINLADIGAQVRGGEGGDDAPKLKKRHGSFTAQLDALDGASRTGADIRLVDPSDCAPWTWHNRRYDLLSPERCADLIEGIEAQGRQEFPAIVRPRKGAGEGPLPRYEIICGARRHWTIHYLNRQGRGPYRFLIDIRELDDEAAFRLADIENRDRVDLSDYERAVDYLTALDRYYDGNLSHMAKRLEVTREWLSKHIQLARTPLPVIQAFADPTQITERAMRGLRKAMNGHEDTVVAEAERILAIQERLGEAGQRPLSAASVLSRLKAAAAPPSTAPRTPVRRIHAADGTVLLERRDTPSGECILRIPAGVETGTPAFAKALWQALGIRP